MPTVPTADDFNVAPTIGAGAIPIGRNPEEVAGAQAQGLGAGMSAAGSAIGDIAIDRQNIYDQVKVNDALNQARGVVNNLTFDPQVGYRAQKGAAALQRDSGQALPDEYGQKLQTALSNIADANLQTDQQRRMFQQHAAALQTSFTGDVESHMLQQAQNYRVSTNDGTIDLALDEGKRNWQDPDKIKGSLTAAAAAIYDNGQALGWSPAQVDAATLKATSSVHKAVILAALKNNQANYALPYLDRFKGQMTGDDILSVQGHVNQAVWAQMTQSAVQGAATATQPQIAPNDFDRMTQITLQSESGGKRFGPNGQLLTSGAGAQGEMQVMPQTAKNPGFGIRPVSMLPNGQPDPNDLARVGRDYLQAMLQKWGDPGKAWAAYNAGSGAVTNAIVKATAADGSSANWLKYMPAETQAYVTKNTALLGQPGGGAPARPTENDFVTAAISRLPPGAPPQVITSTRAAAVTQFGIINKDFTEKGDNAVASSQRWLAANSGDLDHLPPELAQAVNQYAPGKMSELIDFSHKIARGVVPTSDPVLYNRLASHPDELAGLSDDQYEQLQTKLSPKDYDHFARVRGAIRNQTMPGTDPGQVDFATMNRVLNQHLSELQLPTSAKPTDLQTRADIGTTQKFVTDSILDTQRQIGRKMTPAEINDHVNFLFSKDTTFRNTLFGLDMGHTDPVPVMSLKIGDIPSDSVDQIKASFAKQGKPSPSNADILNVYRRYRIGQAPLPPPRAPRRNIALPVDPTIVEASSTEDEE